MAMTGARQSKDALLAKILRYCRFCAEETPHEVRNGLSGALLICVRCRERALLEELDRD